MVELIGDIIIYVLATAIPLLLAALGIRVNNQRIENRKASDLFDLEARLNFKITKLQEDLTESEQGRDVLQKQLDAQVIIVGDLRKQTLELGHFKMLYETLKESHDMLKTDHQQLKADFAGLKAAHEIERSERAKLAQTYNELYAQHVDVVSERDSLAMQNRVHQSQWLILGDWIRDLIQTHPKYSKEFHHERLDTEQSSPDSHRADPGLDGDLPVGPADSGASAMGDGGGSDPGADAG